MKLFFRGDDGSQQILIKKTPTTKPIDGKAFGHPWQKWSLADWKCLTQKELWPL